MTAPWIAREARLASPGPGGCTAYVTSRTLATRHGMICHRPGVVILRVAGAAYPLGRYCRQHADIMTTRAGDLVPAPRIVEEVPA